MNILRKIVQFIKNLQLWAKIVGGILLAVVLILIVSAITKSGDATDTPLNVAHVQVSTVASLSDEAGPLPVTGKVTSVNKASILAVSSGEIVSLRRSLGDRVAAGEVIASFENSSQRAAVLQAQGAYEGALAALAKAKGSQSGSNATVSANAALKSAYATLDDAVHTKADTLFTNPRTSIADLILLVPDDQLVRRIESQRVQLEPQLQSVSTFGSDPSNANIDSNITTMTDRARVVEALLSDLVSALTKAIPTTDVTSTEIATYQASIGAARSAVIGVMSSLSAAKSAYNSTVSGTSSNIETANDIASAEANVKTALGGLNAANSNLEKTIIRAPISGTIVSLPITRGGYVSAFTQVAQISNPSALEIEAYVTSADAKTLAVGGKVLIEGGANGVIVFIAPAIDPSTGKIQVKIGIPGSQSTLTDGDTVTLTLSRATANNAKTTVQKSISIPLAATKITPNGPIVFTVSSSTLVSKQIKLGAILGGKVTVTEGLTLDMEIVTDARGLSDGQNVIVDQTE